MVDEENLRTKVQSGKVINNWVRFAVFSGNVELLEWLVKEFKVDLGKRFLPDENNRNLLHIAYVKTHAEMVKKLESYVEVEEYKQALQAADRDEMKVLDMGVEGIGKKFEEHTKHPTELARIGGFEKAEKFLFTILAPTSDSLGDECNAVSAAVVRMTCAKLSFGHES